MADESAPTPTAPASSGSDSGFQPWMLPLFLIPGVAQGYFSTKAHIELQTRQRAQQATDDVIRGLAQQGRTEALEGMTDVGVKLYGKDYFNALLSASKATRAFQEHMRGQLGQINQPGQPSMGPSTPGAAPNTDPLAAMVGQATQAPPANYVTTAPQAPAPAAPPAAPAGRAPIVPPVQPTGAAGDIDERLVNFGRSLSQRGTRGMSIQTAPGVTESSSVDYERVNADRFLGVAQQMNVPWSTMAKSAQAAGVSIPVDRLNEYGRISHDATVQQIMQQVTGGKRMPTPEEFRDAHWSAFAQNGWATPDIRAILAPNQDDVDRQFMRVVANNPNVPMDRMLNAFQMTIGSSPSQQIIGNVMEQRRAQVEQQVRGEAPQLANNPAALQDEINRRLGFFGTTEAERTRANAPAPITPEAAQQFTVAGQPVPLERNVGVPAQAAPAAPALAGAPAPPVAAPTPGPGAAITPSQAVEAGAQQAARAAGQREQTTAEAQVVGRETGRAVERVPEGELERHYMPETGGPPPTGLRRADLERGVREGKIGQLTEALDQVKNTAFLRETMRQYRDALSVLEPVLGKSWLTQRLPAAFTAEKTPITIPGLGNVVTLPPLPNITGLTPEQQEAAVRLSQLRNTALLTLRSIAQGERGQGISSRIIGAGQQTFPTLTDNPQTAFAALRGWEERINTVTRDAVTYQRTPITASDIHEAASYLYPNPAERAKALRDPKQQRAIQTEAELRYREKQRQ